MSSKNSLSLHFVKARLLLNLNSFSVIGIIIVGIDHFVMSINAELPKESFCHSYVAMTFVFLACCVLSIRLMTSEDKGHLLCYNSLSVKLLFFCTCSPFTVGWSHLNFYILML